MDLIVNLNMYRTIIFTPKHYTPFNVLYIFESVPYNKDGIGLHIF